MEYFVIHNSDGDTIIDKISRGELLKRLNPVEPYYGKMGILQIIKEMDTNYWGDNILIIKGEIVVPEVKTVVTELDIK